MVKESVGVVSLTNLHFLVDRRRKVNQVEGEPS